MIAIWPAAPPKEMKPSLTQNRNASAKGTAVCCRTAGPPPVASLAFAPAASLASARIRSPWSVGISIPGQPVHQRRGPRRRRRSLALRRQRGLEPLRELARVADAPVVEEQGARLFHRHVIVNRDDVDV